MHRKTALTITVVAALGLTGCGSAQGGTSKPAPTVTVTETVTAEAKSISSSPATSAAASPTATASANPSAEGTARDFGEGKESSRGYVQKTLGEWAGIGKPEDPLLEFRITDIEVDPKCTADYGSKPTNGHFLAVHVEAEAFDGLREANYDSEFSFKNIMAGWESINADGNTSAADPFTMDAMMCLNDKEQMPDLGDNQKGKGTVVLDVEDPSGILVFAPEAMESGWEWEYGN